MEQKLPYYMVYPMPVLFEEEKQTRRDLEYMKNIIPGRGKTADTICGRRMRPAYVRRKRDL